MLTPHRRPLLSLSLRAALAAAVLGAPLLACSSANGGGGAQGGAREELGLCADLARSAQASFAASSAQYLACSADSDCAYVAVGTSGACAAACGVLAGASSVPAAVAAASHACQAFDAAGCPAPEIPCVKPPPVVCAAGSCTAYRLSVTQTSPTLKHGACGVFALSYEASGGTPDAPHAIDVPLEVTNGTLYADAACTQPLGATGSILIAAGGTQSPFGLVPTSAGAVEILMNDGAVPTFTAQ